MAQREPKSRTKTSIEVVGRDGTKRGTLEISSGNVSYFRADAKNKTGQWTLQQLIDVLEQEKIRAESEHLAPKLERLSTGSDIIVFITDTKGHLSADENTLVLEERWPLRKFNHERKLDHGTFQIDSPKAKPSWGLRWSIEIGIATALYIVDLYVKKRLSVKRGIASVDTETPVSRQQVLQLLNKWQKAIEA